MRASTSGRKPRTSRARPTPRKSALPCWGSAPPPQAECCTWTKVINTPGRPPASAVSSLTGNWRSSGTPAIQSGPNRSRQHAHPNNGPNSWTTCTPPGEVDGRQRSELRQVGTVRCLRICWGPWSRTYEKARRVPDRGPGPWSQPAHHKAPAPNLAASFRELPGGFLILFAETRHLHRHLFAVFTSQRDDVTRQRNEFGFHREFSRGVFPSANLLDFR